MTDWKAVGNAKFTSGDFAGAISDFTKGIEADPKNHVLFSNRSACHASLRNYEAALKDSLACIQIKPDWAKGYSRKGTALLGLDKIDEAKAAFEAGLVFEKTNQALLDGLAECGARQAFKVPQLFPPESLAKLQADPRTAAYCTQPDFLNILKSIHADPQQLSLYLSDPRILQAMSVVTGIDLGMNKGSGEPSSSASAPAPAPAPAAKPAASKPKEEPKAPEPDDTLTPEEREGKERAARLKEEGNTAYKAHDFARAISLYSEAAALDPSNVTYPLNLSAVYLEQQDYPKCLEVSKQAVDQMLTLSRPDFKLLAKGYSRMASSHMAMEQYEDAIKCFNKSLTNDNAPATRKKLLECEAAFRDAKALADFDEDKAAAAKTEGNDLFQAKKYPEAIEAYTKSIRHNPKDAKVWANRAASYNSMGAFVDGLRDANKAIELDPAYVKAYSRKGYALYWTKEYNNALAAYDAGLKIDPNNADCKAGLQTTLAALQKAEASLTPEERRAKAEQDPEVQEILHDPVFQEILRQMKTDPAAVQDHLRNPLVMSKLQKLIDAGIVSLGSSRH